MTEKPVPYQTQGDAVEAVVIGGDLSKLSAEQRVTYYQRVCESLGLNPLTKPFAYIVLNQKLTMYATRDAADQLRKRDNVSIDILGRKMEGDLYIVTARASTPDGRHDECAGIVSIAGLVKSDLANACMKAETKARRRVTLSLCGLGFDDTDAEDVAVGRAEYAEVEAAPQVIEACGPEGATESQSWIQDPARRKAFWAKAHSRGLSDEDVHALSGYDHLSKWQGTEEELWAKIDAAIAQKAQPVAEVEA